MWAPEWGEPSAWDKGLQPPRRGPLSRLTRGGLASLFQALRGEGEQRALGSDGRAHRGSEGLSNFSGVSSIAGLRTRPCSECRQALGVELGSLNSGLSLSACCVAPGTLPNLSGPCLLTHMSMPCGLGRWRLWVGKVLFLCFHVGLSLKEQFWAEITVTCTPPLGRSGPYVLDSWTTLQGAPHWEGRKREDLGLQFCSRVVCGGGHGAPNLRCPGWPQWLQPSSSTQDGRLPPVTARALHAQYGLAHQESLGCHPRVQAGLPALLPQNR